MSVVSVIAPCRNEEKFIKAFLDNMLSQDFPKDQLEIFVIDGNSVDNTQKFINEYSEKYSFIKLLINERQTVPFALNKAISVANGEFIIRVDLHATYPDNYITELICKIKNLKADNVGGVCLTLPANNNILSHSIAIVMGNGFGVGNSYFRIGIDQITKVDTVPFGCFRRELFDRIGLFDEELTRNQDDEFNGRIIKNGGSIYLLPNLEIQYYARDSVDKMAKMFYQYGLFKPLVNKKLGAPATIRQFVPLCFLLGLVLGGIASCFSETIFAIYISVLAIYVVAAICFTRKEIQKEPRQLLYIPWLFAVIHISYGWGYLQGIFKFLILNKHTVNVKINR